MNVQVAVVCDAATDYHGKLCLLGTFDTIFTRQLPAVHPSCAIVLRIVFSRVEEGNHRIKIDFVDEDGKPVMRGIESAFDLRLPANALYICRNFIVNIQQLKFEREGHYSVDIAVDGRQEASIPLSVRVVQAPAPPAN